MKYVVPFVVIVVLLAVFYARVPDRSIPSYIDHELIEANYGQEMDAALATLETDTADEMLAERKRLSEQFEKDPLIVSVWLEDGRDKTSNHNIFRRHLDNVSRRTCSSYKRKYVEDGLMRCTLWQHWFGGTETLKYRRYAWTKEGYRLEVSFDYERFLQQFPAPRDTG